MRAPLSERLRSAAWLIAEAEFMPETVKGMREWWARSTKRLRALTSSGDFDPTAVAREIDRVLSSLADLARDFSYRRIAGKVQSEPSGSPLAYYSRALDAIHDLRTQLESLREDALEVAAAEALLDLRRAGDVAEGTEPPAGVDREAWHLVLRLEGLGRRPIADIEQYIAGRKGALREDVRAVLRSFSQRFFANLTRSFGGVSIDMGREVPERATVLGVRVRFVLPYDPVRPKAGERTYATKTIFRIMISAVEKAAKMVRRAGLGDLWRRVPEIVIAPKYEQMYRWGPSGIGRPLSDEFTGMYFEYDVTIRGKRRKYSAPAAAFIVFYPTSIRGTFPTEKTVVHEFAHYVWYRVLPEKARRFFAEHWRDVGVTDYARTDKEEAFAELLAFAIVDPKELTPSEWRLLRKTLEVAGIRTRL